MEVLSHLNSHQGLNSGTILEIDVQPQLISRLLQEENDQHKTNNVSLALKGTLVDELNQKNDQLKEGNVMLASKELVLKTENERLMNEVSQIKAANRALQEENNAILGEGGTIVELMKENEELKSKITSLSEELKETENARPSTSNCEVHHPTFNVQLQQRTAKLNAGEAAASDPPSSGKSKGKANMALQGNQFNRKYFGFSFTLKIT